jgi:broad specificity phosphatase PhoE
MSHPELWLCRHGETEWSRDGRHTSHTDLPLTDDGVAQARGMAPLFDGLVFDLVLRSPLQRSAETATAVGFPEAMREPALAEWDYGDYEGVTTARIREDVPGWTVFTHPTPGGESADQVAARADRIIARVLDEATDRALVFSHGHLLRVLAARWIDEPPALGQRLLLDTGSVSVLGWEREVRAIRRWNIGAAD